MGIVYQVDCHAEVWGTYHYNAMQPVNQDGFVMHVLEEAAKLDKELEKILPELEIELLPVERPYIRNSALNCAKIMATFGIKQRSRGEGVTGVINEIYGIKKAAVETAAGKKADPKKNVKKGNAKKITKGSSTEKAKVKARPKKVSPKKSPPQKPPAKKAAKQK